MKVNDLMTKKPVTVKPTDSIGTVVKLLAKHSISGCPVVSNGKLVGMVTQTDVIKAIDVYQNINREEMLPLVAAIIKSRRNLDTELKIILKKKVSSFPKKKIIAIDSQEDLYKAARLINRHNIDRLPVTSNGRLVGIVSKTDIINRLGALKNN